MQTPQYQMDSLASLRIVPIMAAGRPQLQVLGGVATSGATPPTPWSRSTTCRRMVQIYAAVQGRDLGSVAADIRRIVGRRHRFRCPRASLGGLLGQVRRWNRRFRACCSVCWARSC
jgi:Cu/Ag efflux pump CusA